MESDHLFPVKEHGTPSAWVTSKATSKITLIRMTRKIVGEYKLAHVEMHTYFEGSIGMVSNWRKRGPIAVPLPGRPQALLPL